LTVDASSIAVDAILPHIYNDNTERPIALASHLLTKAERRKRGTSNYIWSQKIS